MAQYQSLDNYYQAIQNELARRKSPDYLRLRPYLNTLRQRNPESYYPRMQSPAYGYATGTRYSGIKDHIRKGVPWSVHLREGMPPDEHYDTLLNEYGHIGIDRQPSQNWAYILDLLKPTERLSELLVGDYPKMLRLEEGMLRHLGLPNLMTNKYVRVPFALTQTQKDLLPYLERFLKYGENVGSIWGPEYPEEYQGEKGIPIVPKFEFNPSPEERSTTAMKSRLGNLLKNIK